MSFWLTTL